MTISSDPLITWKYDIFHPLNTLFFTPKIAVNSAFPKLPEINVIYSYENITNNGAGITAISARNLL